jgi:2-polyprenyl-3-methyl-5-hydroxy-6-metoxy-1,4-benzoquinol methylase
MPGDLAGREYWDQAWEAEPLPQPVDPEEPGARNYVRRRYDRLFREVFHGLPENSRLLEIGAARSPWLPYFARRFGMRVTGLDYSPAGCEQARDVLAGAGVNGDVVCTDLFAPPDGLLGQFDALVSFGVVEHFDDTAAVLRAFGRYLRPGGVMVTFVPNMTGLTGLLQRRLNRPVYDVHVPLDRSALERAHTDAGLVVDRCRYLLGANPGVVNLSGVPSRTPGWFLKKGLLWGLSRLARTWWWIEARTGAEGANRLTSPYVVCVARRR